MQTFGKRDGPKAENLRVEEAIAYGGAPGKTGQYRARKSGHRDED
jgi:hypothetical protein